MEQPTVETEQGKQVLVAKCAFSEQRNDSYVLASVVTGTLPRVELTETTHCCFSHSSLYEWSPPLMEESLLLSGLTFGNKVVLINWLLLITKQTKLCPILLKLCQYSITISFFGSVCCQTFVT